MEKRNKLFGIVITAALIIAVFAAIFSLQNRSHKQPVASNEISDRARADLERRAKDGDPEAQYALTLLVDDPFQQRRLMEQAVSAGYPPAVTTYAVSIMSEKPGDAQRAKRLLQDAALKGYYPAIVELAHCVEIGACGPASEAEALQWMILSRLLASNKIIEKNLIRADEERILSRLSNNAVLDAEAAARKNYEQVQERLQRKP